MNQKMIFEAIIKKIGPEAQELSESGVIVLFGQNVPKELEKYCFIISECKINSEITINDKLYIGDRLYKVTDLGEVVNKNLREIGHITLMINSNNHENVLAGSVHLQGDEYPNITEGTKIKILRKCENVSTYA